MLSILTYHSLDSSGSVVSVAPEEFARQMALISSVQYRGVSLREALDHREQLGYWPDQCVVLTFDDGFKNFYAQAMPVLARYGFTATVFVVSGYMGKRNDWERPPEGLGSQEILTWSQALELSSTGIEIGSHTKTHPDLTRLSITEIQDEVAGSKMQIEDRLGQTVISFAYPYGETCADAHEIVMREFNAACTTLLQRANGDTLHRLPRIDMYYVRSENSLERLLHGKLDKYLAFRSLGRSIRRLVH